MFEKYLQPLTQLDSRVKQNVLLTTICLMFVLYSYPLIRSSTDSLFIGAIGAKKSPYVWIYSIIALSISVMIYNAWQNVLTIQKLFLTTSLLSIAVFLWCLYMIHLGGNSFWYYLLFITKEVYIILLLQMGHGFLNETLNFSSAKILLGPINAMEGLAGIFGGLTTSTLTYYTNTETILVFGIFTIIICAIFFVFTKSDSGNTSLEKNASKPLDSIKGVRRYVFWIVLLVTTSQFCINLINYKFNMVLEAEITDKLLKTRYLGEVNTWINTVGLLMQLSVVPLALRFFKVKYLHLFIPIAFFVTYILSAGLGAGALLPLAMTFAFYKGADYSIFCVAKELLYYPLTISQKYGAKYVVDMVVYRLAKGVISVILIFVSTNVAINIMLISLLLLWPILLVPLFREQKKLLK